MLDLLKTILFKYGAQGMRIEQLFLIYYTLTLYRHEYY